MSEFAERTGTYYDMPDGMYPVHLFHPGFQTLGQWFPANDAWVLEWLCHRCAPDDALEIGSFVGTSASILARHFWRVLCVDTWTGSGPDDQITQLYAEHDVLDVFRRNIPLIDPNIMIHKRDLDPDSLPDMLEFREVKYDLIFIDGAHDYDSVVKDIQIAKKWIAPGGIICGHDYTFFPGVTQAVNEFGFDGALGTVWWREMA